MAGWPGDSGMTNLKLADYLNETIFILWDADIPVSQASDMIVALEARCNGVYDQQELRLAVEQRYERLNFMRSNQS